jgi:TPR repeat protein
MTRLRRGIPICQGAIFCALSIFLVDFAESCEPVRLEESVAKQRTEVVEIAPCAPEHSPRVTDERSRRVAAEKSKKFANTKHAKDLLAEAMQAEARGDYAHAARLYRSLARQGHGPAAIRLGEMYATGVGNVSMGVPRDLKESRQWYEQARENGEKMLARP